MERFTITFKSINRIAYTSRFEAVVEITTKSNTEPKRSIRTIREGDDVLGRKIGLITSTTRSASFENLGMIIGEMTPNNNFVVYEGQTIEVADKWFEEIKVVG